jgi:hypothetical protein
MSVTRTGRSSPAVRSHVARGASALAFALACAAAACSDDAKPDAGAADATVVVDLGVVADAGDPDAGAADLGVSDAAASDLGAEDAARADVEPASDAQPGIDGGVRQATCPPPQPSAPPLPEDPSARGPYLVGARSATIAGVWSEIWYPAPIGSQGKSSTTAYDIRLELPPSERAKIPDEAAPLQSCDCYRELPIAPGSWPVIVFVHGTAAFRTQSLTLMTHWASRGFVVIAGTHAGLRLADILQGRIGVGDPVADVVGMLAAIRAGGGPLAFAAGAMDPTRIGLAGHSAGGGTIARLGGEQGVYVLEPMASGGSSPDISGPSTLVLGARNDGIVPYPRIVDGYARSNGPKWLVGLADAGHLAFSDLCVIAAEEGGLLAVAQRYGIAVNPLVARLARDGCEPTALAPAAGLEVVRAASTAAFELGLTCLPERAADLAGLPQRFTAVGEYREQR